MTVVLDTSAILAMLWGEPGGERVEAVIDNALVCSVNHAELVAKLVDRGANAGQIDEVLAALDLPVADFGTDLAREAGELRRTTRPQGLSLADRCCLALAMSGNLRVLTADRAWGALDLAIDIEVIR